MEKIKDVLALIVTIGAAGGFAFGVIKAVFSFVTTLEEMKKMIKSQRGTNRIMIKGTLAALQGLERLGANGPVTEARAELEEYLIKEAS